MCWMLCCMFAWQEVHRRQVLEGMERWNQACRMRTCWVERHLLSHVFFGHPKKTRGLLMWDLPRNDAKSRCVPWNCRRAPESNLDPPVPESPPFREAFV